MSAVTVFHCSNANANYREMRTGNELVGDSVKDGKKTEEAAGDKGMGYIKLEDTDSARRSLFRWSNFVDF